MAHEESMKKMGINTKHVNAGSFAGSSRRNLMKAETQRECLEFHRDNVFLKREINA